MLRIMGDREMQEFIKFLLKIRKRFSRRQFRLSRNQHSAKKSTGFTKKNSLFIFLAVLVAIFVLRVVLFANSYGGVEHDSGWYLGVARNMAERGIYASYTNTIAEEGPGAHVSLHGRFSVQDKDGFSYFPAGVTVGPGYVLPEALLLKLFGYGWWQFRLWPLIGFACLLFLLFYTTFRIANVFAVVILALWIWVVPQATTGYAFESFSEHIATLFVLISFYLCALFVYSPINRKKLIFFSGMFFAFAFLTKNLSFLSIGSFVIIAIYDFWKHRKKLLFTFLCWILFVVGVALPIAAYEGYRYWFLTSHFGYEGWHAINEDIRLTFQSGGSGISNIDFSKLDWVFVWKKIYIWLDVGIKEPLLVWVLILLSPLILFAKIKEEIRVIFIMMYVSIFSIFTWYIFISPAGWARHAWTGIFEGMVITSSSIGYFIYEIINNNSSTVRSGSRSRQVFQKLFNKTSNLYFLFLLIVALHLAVRPESLTLTPFLTSDTITKWQGNRFIRSLEGFPSTPILSLKDQKELVAFFNSHIQKNDKIYYAGWFIHAEVPPLVDKVFFSLNRYFTLNQKNPDGGKSYLILGPYQQGPWSFEPPQYVPTKIAELCTKAVFKNPSYALCTLRSGLVYNNPAY
jgi:hypothetical protein